MRSVWGVNCLLCGYRFQFFARLLFCRLESLDYKRCARSGTRTHADLLQIILSDSELPLSDSRLIGAFAPIDTMVATLNLLAHKKIDCMKKLNYELSFFLILPTTS